MHNLGNKKSFWEQTKKTFILEIKRMRRTRFEVKDVNDMQKTEEVKALKSSLSTVQQSEKELMNEIARLEKIESKLLQDQTKLKKAIEENSV